MLKYSPANAKTEALKEVDELKTFLENKRRIYSLDLLSGYSCPFAEKCLSRAVVFPNGKRKIIDGRKTEFRCFSASQEVQYTNVFKLRQHNFNTLRGLSLEDMIHRLNTDLPKNAGIIRIHVAGDFFNPDYMYAWMNVAMMNPDRLFYAYTKSIKYWLKYIETIEQVDNFILTASYGGRDDDLIYEHGLRHCNVITAEADTHLPIDHDDSHAARPSQRHNSFSLLIHGTQPKGSLAAEALKLLKKNSVRHSYNRKKEPKEVAIE
jgi:hypothetical protein